MEFRKCHLQSTASFSVADRASTECRLFLVMRWEGRQNNQVHIQGLSPPFAPFSRRAIESLLRLCLGISFGFTLFVCLFLVCSYKGLFSVGVRNAVISPPPSANCFVLLARSFFIVPFLSTSSTLLSCTPPDACLLTTLPLDFSPQHSMGAC